MKLSDWARQQRIHYNTAYRWFNLGKIKGAFQMDTGTIIVPDSDIHKNKEEKIVLYARVSSQKQKQDLKRQVERLEQFSNSNGYIINKTYKEIASGMNDKRRQLCLMLDYKPTKIIVENKDRLTRFGFNYIEKLLKQLGCEIILLNKEKVDENDLMKDLVSIITSFCCRLYGLRKGQNKAKKIKEELKNDNDKTANSK